MSYDDVLYTVNETANGSYTYAENPYIGLAVLKAKRADKIQSYTSDSFLKPANRTDDSGNKQENDAYIAAWICWVYWRNELKKLDKFIKYAYNINKSIIRTNNKLIWF